MRHSVGSGNFSMKDNIEAIQNGEPQKTKRKAGAFLGLAVARLLGKCSP